MTLANLLPTDTCPICKNSLEYSFGSYVSCSNICQYRASKTFIAFSTPKYHLLIWHDLDQLWLKQNDGNSNFFMEEFISLNQSDFINFDWSDKEIDSKLDTLWFYN